MYNLKHFKISQISTLLKKIVFFIQNEWCFSIIPNLKAFIKF